MLKGISPLLTPDLLKTLAEMGNGDEIILADAHFPGHNLCRLAHRADGQKIAPLLDAIMPLFELDRSNPPLIMMDVVPGDMLDFDVEYEYMNAIKRHHPRVQPILRLEKSVFLEKAQKAYACVITGEQRKYANIILRKGVTPIAI